MDSQTHASESSTSFPKGVGMIWSGSIFLAFAVLNLFFPRGNSAALSQAVGALCLCHGLAYFAMGCINYARR